MITKSDWDAVRQQFERQNYRMANDPPATDDLLAYTRGELRDAHAERVRQYLAANPDVAHALTEPFPESEAAPGELGYLSPEELSRQWSVLQEKVHDGGDARFTGERRWRRAALALAAMFALAVFGNLWQAASHRRVSQRGHQWPIASEQILIPPHDGQRGPGDVAPPTLTFDRPGYALVLQSSGMARAYGEYRIDTVDVGKEPPRVVRSQTGFSRGADGTITLFLERGDLPPGEYQFRLFGLDGDRAVPLETYPLRVR